MKWFVYTRGTIHIYRLAHALLGVHEFATKLNNIPFEDVLYINEDSKFWWAWGDKEIRNLGKKILKKCSTKNGRRKHFQKLENCAEAAIVAAEKLRKINLARCSNEELIKLYEFFYQKSGPAQGLLDIDIDAIDVVFENFLRKKIRKEIKTKINPTQFAELYKEISVPLYGTYLAKEEKEIIKLALKKSVSPRAVKKLYDKFWWTKLGWESMAPYKLKDFVLRIKNYSKRKDLRKQLANISRRPIQTKKRRNYLIKKYKLSKEIASWLKVMDKYTYLHDLRKEMQVKTTYSFYLLMVETARRLKLSKDDLEWLWYDEVKDLLRGKKFNKQEVKRRKQAICVIVSKKGIKTWSGRAAVQQHKKELKEKKKEVKEFKGLGVTSGKIRARVKVCSGVEEAFKKVKKGEILVCGMTLPDYVPVMKRAAAIVTDEGGITCHAAIVSRELGKPCIVGTKIATRVLKDGDLVEVDAEKGIVKKIS
jgi:phosphoenolpyruvate synthase/pyruvate phosphate dikinase